MIEKDIQFSYHRSNSLLEICDDLAIQNHRTNRNDRNGGKPATSTFRSGVAIRRHHQVRRIVSLRQHYRVNTIVRDRTNSSG